LKNLRRARNPRHESESTGRLQEERAGQHGENHSVGSDGIDSEQPEELEEPLSKCDLPTTRNSSGVKGVEDFSRSDASAKRTGRRDVPSFKLALPSVRLGRKRKRACDFTLTTVRSGRTGEVGR